MGSDYTDGQRVQHYHARAIPFRRLDRFGIGRRIRSNPRAGKRDSSARGGLVWKIIAADSAPGHARGLLRAWTGWERLSEMLWPTADVPESPHKLVRIRVERFRRAAVTLPGGVEITRGAFVGELHCNNRALLRLMQDGRNPFAACREDLRGLAAWIQNDPMGRRLIALHASTILAKGAKRFGFTVVNTPITLRRRMERIFFTGLLLLYSREGLERLRHGTTAHVYPRDIWITRHELIRLYFEHNGRERGRTVGEAEFDDQDQPAQVARPNTSER